MEGRLAPTFVLRDAQGRDVSSSSFFGTYTVLYFYPKAGTPGCTREAQGFQELLEQFRALDAQVFGISPDREEALARFAQNQGLDFPLLADPNREVARLFGVLNQGKLQRSTFLLDRASIIRRVWRGVRVEGHAQEVLQALHEVRALDQAVNPLIAVRRAKRALREDSLPREDLQRLIEAAHLAPSCFNNQPWRFVVVTGEKLGKVKEALPGGNYWALVAPAIIAVAAHRDLDCKLSDNRDYFLFDCGMAVGFLMVQATQMGLVAHPIAGYDPIAVKQALHIPEDYVLITLVVVGKPGDPARLSEKHRAIELGPRERKPLDQVLCWETMPKMEVR